MKRSLKSKISSITILLIFLIFAETLQAQRRPEVHNLDRGSKNNSGRIDRQPISQNPQRINTRPSRETSTRVRPQIPSSQNPRPRNNQNNILANSRNSRDRRGYDHDDHYHYSNRRPVYNAHNPSWRYLALPGRNTVIRVFPFSYQTINYGGYGYRYYNGTFYRPYNNAFIVVAPPFGLFINVMPFGYRRILVRDYPYYYYNGTYYDQFQNNYRVVKPPLEAVVESIPQGYETIVVDGDSYYKVDGVQYKPTVQDNGEIWYEVIKTD